MGWSEKSGPSAPFWWWDGGRGCGQLGAVVSPGHPELVKGPSVPGGMCWHVFSTLGMMLRYQMRVRERIDLSVCILLWETVNSKARDLVSFILINPQCFIDVNWIERKLFLGRGLWKWHARCLKRMLNVWKARLSPQGGSKNVGQSGSSENRNGGRGNRERLETNSMEIPLGLEIGRGERREEKEKVSFAALGIVGPLKQGGRKSSSLLPKT